MREATKARRLAATDAPYLMVETDPAYPHLVDNRGSNKEALTNGTGESIVEGAQKLKLKDDKPMNVYDKKQTFKASTAARVVYCAAWLVEAAFRGLVGWVLLTKFDMLLTTIAGIYALGTAAAIVGLHFYNAHN